MYCDSYVCFMHQVHILRWSSVCDRAAPLRAHPGGHGEGHCDAMGAPEWLPCRQEVWLGLSRPPCGTYYFLLKKTLRKGLCKVKKNSKNPKKTWIELTHPPSKLGNPSLTWAEHSNHNNQQLLAMQTGYTWHTPPKYYHWFKAILG